VNFDWASQATVEGPNLPFSLMFSGFSLVLFLAVGLVDEDFFQMSVYLGEPTSVNEGFEVKHGINHS